MRKLLSTSAIALSIAAGAATAAEFGTAEEAQAMLEQAIVALEADQAAALAAFNAGEAPFRDRDLYVFCGGADGLFTAHGANASLIGQSMAELNDKAGKPLGAAIYDAGVEGEVNTVEYMWPRPNEEEPVTKVSYVTKVGDQTCGVGYYQ
jgi:signal transduction histidine kinase